MNRLLAVSFMLLTILACTNQISAQDNLGTEDLLFLQRAAKSGFLEVRLGKLAMDHGESQAVKSLGERMIDDHTRSNQELQMLAQKRGVTLPPDDSSPLVNMPMAKATGKDFDRLFREGIIKNHEEDITMFEREVMSGTDDDSKAWASKTLVTMKKHLADTRALPE